VAHTVSAECVTSLSAYFQFRPKVKLPLLVDLYLLMCCLNVVVLVVKLNSVTEAGLSVVFSQILLCYVNILWIRELHGNGDNGNTADFPQ